MTVKDFLDRVEELLLSKGESQRETMNILKALRMDHPKLNRLESTAEVDDTLVTDILKQFSEDVPVQYITSMAFFFGLRFYVDKWVLIPRPETEELIYNIIQYVQCSELDILDIGTGSGCIPITLKSKCDQSTITAIDVSPEALSVAKKNAAHHQVEIDFREVNFLEEKEWSRLESYDVIISNPPYISHSEKSKMDISTIKHEPDIALFTDSDPLVFYKKIFLFSHHNLNAGGAIFMELNEFNAEQTIAIFKNDYECQLIEDLQGKSRILKCSK